MSDMTEILELPDGRYTFVVGAQKYTLSTPLPRETFFRIVRSVQSAEKEIPKEITSYSDRIFLAFMSYVSKVDDLTMKLESMTENEGNTEV